MISKLKTVRHFFTCPNKRILFYMLLKSSNKVDLKTNLEASYKWLCTAQDATSDDGVAAWYDLLRGWESSYPETTGYIIPTFLTYAKVMSETDAKKRAIRMADWEIEVQLPSGAVRSGSMSAKVGPAVFNTGQVLFGWTAAYKETADKRYAEAIKRAADWLIEQQDADGAWRKNLSLMTQSKVQTYNVRSAWGLAMAGYVLNEVKWISAAEKNCDWALKQQKDNGWFENNAFSENEAPLLHTIGYVLEGLAGMGELLKNDKYLVAAKNGVDPLVKIMKSSALLKGRYDSQWKSPVSSRCLTGEAQIAIVLHRLSKHFHESGYADVAHLILNNLAKVQDVKSAFPEIHGGLTGSEPIWGDYIPWCFPNWAVKFFMDALFLDLLGVDVY